MSLSLGLGLGLTRNKGGSFYTGWPLAFDFVNNKYRVGVGRGYSSSFIEQPGVAYTRTGADLLSYNPVTGKWQAFAANAPALLTGAGQDIPEGTTNKCANYNAAPQALVAPTTAAGFNAAGVTGVSASGGDANTRWSVVDDTAALRAAGFGDLIDAGKMNGRVFCIDNSLGVGNAVLTYSEQYGNTNKHSLSAVIRGGAGVQQDNGGGAVGPFPASASYRRVKVENATPSVSNARACIIAPTGSAVYFILNQLEEKAYATNPVIVSGAAATRGNAQPVVTGLSSILTPPFTLVAVGNLSAIDGVTRRLVSLRGAGSSALTLVRTTTNTLASGSSDTSFVEVAGFAGPRLAKAAVAIRTATRTLSANGSSAVSINNIALPAVDRLDIGHNNGAGFPNSPLLFVGVAPDLTDAQLQAITASNGALTDFL